MVRRRRWSWLLAVLALAAAWGLLRAAEPAQGVVEGQIVVTLQGKPKADASGLVLYLVGFQEPPATAVPKLAQRDRTFQPSVLPVTAGQTVAFPNDDPYFHNVFSLSPTRQFDLGQYRQGETRTRAFPKAGIVEVFCNIHPQMAATILVLPNRRWAVTDKSGAFRIDGVPPGNWQLFAYSRFADKPLRQNVTVAAGNTLRLDLRLDEVRTDQPHTNKFGQPYREGGGYK